MWSGSPAPASNLLIQLHGAEEPHLASGVLRKLDRLSVTHVPQRQTQCQTWCSWSALADGAHQTEPSLALQGYGPLEMSAGPNRLGVAPST